mmetsp:Transcript_22654/g.73673  ORF Transcript_22654/g.73673 Transcript_22654/m.73673 type:complete len:213 (+) Transcript_22654:1144-1782(+)
MRRRELQLLCDLEAELCADFDDCALHLFEVGGIVVLGGADAALRGPAGSGSCSGSGGSGGFDCGRRASVDAHERHELVRNVKRARGLAVLRFVVAERSGGGRHGSGRHLALGPCGCGAFAADSGGSSGSAASHTYASRLGLLRSRIHLRLRLLLLLVSHIHRFLLHLPLLFRCGAESVGDRLGRFGGALGGGGARHRRALARLLQEGAGRGG